MYLGHFTKRVKSRFGWMSWPKIEQSWIELIYMIDCRTCLERLPIQTEQPQCVCPHDIRGRNRSELYYSKFSKILELISRIQEEPTNSEAAWTFLEQNIHIFFLGLSSFSELSWRWSNFLALFDDFLHLRKKLMNLSHRHVPPLKIVILSDRGVVHKTQDTQNNLPF